MSSTVKFTEKEREKQATQITIVGFIVNLILTAAKFIAGIIGKSNAMVADAVHSLSDFLTDIIVIVFIKVASKPKDKNHHYGHGKFEIFATIIIGVFLVLVALGLIWNGIKLIISFTKGVILEKPGLIALIAAIVSIVIKEALYWYTYLKGKKINSMAVIGNAWHHRSDAFSSIGTLLGISGAIFLGEKWRILDPISAIIVSIFILKVAFKLIMPNINDLLEISLPEKIENEILEIINNTDPEIKNSHNLKTRRIGNNYAIEIHIKVDKDMTVESSHNIATKIETNIREKYGENTHVAVHIEPF
ncbi:MAG TPA: cation diffusion facilitator family transporter [Spirochaetota bacterium]|nr:cation diffusion facilitator family transporter [Spirochaetota bacterium]HOL58007.1 cation diffusion facilitator family transporter [Spirochaetota bacterium]HPP04579.1 cation diffusion facilitator family transporter [Spirochaetota bacterium]